MAKRKRNQQARTMLETAILGPRKLYWIGEKSEIYLGDSLDAIVDHFNLHSEAYDPVYGAAFGSISPWHVAVEEVEEGTLQSCPLITIASRYRKWPCQPRQLTTIHYC